MSKPTIGNNGNQCVEVLHDLGLLKNGMTTDEVAEVARPYMEKESHLDYEAFWEDVAIRADELGYAIKK